MTCARGDEFRCGRCRRRFAPRLNRLLVPSFHCLVLIVILTAVLLAAPPLSASGEKLGAEWSEYADIVGTFNPSGIEASGGYEYTNAYHYDERYNAVSSSWTAGGGIDLTPSYLQPSLAFEWMPALFLTARIECDGYFYFGTNGGLLSFSSGKEPFGDRELRARKGTEETGMGSRLLLQPTIQLRLGDIVLRNQSDVARYRFPGRGPFFHEQEYDILLKDGGYLVANRTQALKEIGSATGGGRTYLGPYFELVHAAGSDLTRRQIGVLLYSEPGRAKASSDEAHYFIQIGYNLKDRNREGEIFILVGTGLSSAMK